MALGFPLGWQADLQFLDGLHQVFLGLQPRRLVAAAAGGGGGVVLRAVGQQAVSQGAVGGRQTLEGRAGQRNNNNNKKKQTKNLLNPDTFEEPGFHSSCFSTHFNPVPDRFHRNIILFLLLNPIALI